MAVLLGLGGCSRRPAEAPRLVFAAASLTDVLREVAGQEAVRAAGEVEFNFAGSSELARQIEAGAPADAFFSADERQMERLVAAGRVRAADVHRVLSNSLVVVVPAGPSPTVRAPGDLATVRRLSLADPDAVPAGVYARRWLAGAGLWDRVRGRVLPAPDVRAALAAVASGAAEAGVVYRTDVGRDAGVRVAFDLPSGDLGIVYLLAAVGPRRDGPAADLVRALTGPAARAVYAQQGFVVLDGAGEGGGR